MKKFIIFMLLLAASFSLTGCKWFDDPANVKKVGTGYIQSDNGLLIVEVNGQKYAPERIYTGSRTRDGATSMEPVVGMEVTVFFREAYRDPQFIAGNKTEEYLEEFFTRNFTFVFGVGVLFFIMILWAIFSEPKVKIIHAD